LEEEDWKLKPPVDAGLDSWEAPKLNVGLGIASDDFPNVGVEVFDPKLKPLCAGAGVELALPKAGTAAVGADDAPNENPDGFEAAGVVFSSDVSFFWNGVVLLEPKPPKAGAAGCSTGLLLPNVKGAVEPVLDGLLSFAGAGLLPKENPEDGVDSAAPCVAPNLKGAVDFCGVGSTFCWPNPPNAGAALAGALEAPNALLAEDDCVVLDALLPNENAGF